MTTPPLAPVAPSPLRPLVAPKPTPAPPPVYGLDIETDTAVDGLDPRVARVVAVAVAGPHGVRVFDDADEALLLQRLEWHIASLPPGVLATWNGAAFDLPFLHDRARVAGVRTALRLTLDSTLAVRTPLPGHTGGYRGSWCGHAHLDAYRLFRADVVPALRISGGLKTIARLCGLDPLDLRADALHDYPKDQVSAYVGSDARCTRALVLRRWPTATAALDHPLTARPAGTRCRGGARTTEPVG